MNCKTYQLNDAPNLKPIQFNIINNFGQNLAIKEEPLEYPRTEENETHRTICKEDLKYEELEEHVNIDRIGLGNDDSESGVFRDEQDVKIQELAVEIDNEGWTDNKDIDMAVLKDMKIKSEGLTDEEGMRHDEFDEGQYVKNTMQMVLESARDIENNGSEGAAPAKKSKPTNRSLGEQNIPEKRKRHRMMIEIELTTINTSSDMLKNTKNNATTAMKNRNVNVDSDACINTDVDDVKHLKESFNCNDCANTFDDKYLLITHIEKHTVGKKENNQKSERSARKCAKLRLRKENKHTKTDILNYHFQCDICQRIFTRKVGLYNHLKTHSSEIPFHQRFIKKVCMKKCLKPDSDETCFECAICQRRFAQKGNLRKHMAVHSEQKPYQCELCPRIFKHKPALNKHLRVHSGDRPFKCAVCERSYKLKYALTVHLRTHSRETPFECAKCHRSFAQKAYLRKHLKIHSRVKPFRQQLTEKVSLEKRLNSDSDRTLLECAVCKRSFNKYYMNVHLKTHSKETLFECAICQKRFAAKRYLRNHLKTHSGQKPYQCELCAQKFKLKDALDKHLRAHSGDKPFECAICQRRFCEKYYLALHLRTHNKVKPFECATCNRRFSVKSSLRSHLKIHGGEKLFDCVICKQKFTFKSTLNRHLKSHNDDRPFQCVICQRGFNLKHHLNDHLKTHSKEKPFECAVCGRSFNRKNHLNSHLRIHNGEKPFACPICQQRFNRKDNMKVHLRTHSKDMPK